MMLRACRKSIPVFKRWYSSHPQTLRRTESPVSEVLKLNAGEKISNYVIKQVEAVPELQLAAVLLNHEKTGAEHLHVARDDKNNFFSVSLRTTPPDSKGVMHILEHLALCGSKKYPCRDPFMKMTNRSLATFLNAYTGPDYTMYLFSSQNVKDFENLLNVYADAVFFPQLRFKDFRQEGWRLEHQDINDKNSPIILKGVVFNEMKGVHSDPSQLYARHLLGSLFPVSYSHQYGGDPLDIPDLSWSELCQYHAKYYHPSNSRFFTYGDQPLESHLQLIQDCVLDKFARINIDSRIPEENIWSKPEEKLITCRYDPMAAVQENQTTAAYGFLLNDVTQTHETFVMSVIGNLLVDGPNSPFYKTLLEPGIGADYSPWTGHEGSLKRGFFSIGLRDIATADVDLVKKTIDSTFRDVIRDGFPQERIEGVLHSIELGLKHQSTNFGHSTAMALNSIWNHGGNPILSLKVNEHVQWFQDQMKENPFFLQEKTAQYLKDNPHKLFLVMSPDREYEAKLQNEENKLLCSKLERLTDEDRKLVFSEGIELAEWQEAAEDVSCLPTIHISDIDRDTQRTTVIQKLVDSVPVQLCEQPTNGVIYFRAISTVSGLTEDLLMLVPVFCDIVTKMGAGDSNFKQFDQKAELKTGGLSAGVHLASHPENPSAFEFGVRFSSHCLQHNVQDMMKLWEDVFNRLTLSDKNRLSQLIKQSASDLAQSIPGHGHLYIMSDASSCLGMKENMSEKLTGLAQVAYMKRLASAENYDEVLEKLHVLAGLFLNKKGLRCSLNSNAESMSSSLSCLENFIVSLPEEKTHNNTPFQWNQYQAKSEKRHFVLPFNVNFVGKAMKTVPYTHKDHASLKVASKLLSRKFLLKEIREKGGAYGAGAKLALSGNFTFYTYRDPNVTETLDKFQAGLDWLIEDNYTNMDIDEAKIATFSEEDQPVSPGSRGCTVFLTGLNDDMRQTFRDRLFEVTREDVVAVTKKYLLQAKIAGTSVIGPEHEKTKTCPEWTIIKE